MEINVEAFLDSFEIMGYGMLGIFAVIGSMMVILKLMTLVFKQKD